ncbi:MAG: TonB-dependent receptor domain-containing protein [Muribaculaceae bacterium]
MNKSALLTFLLSLMALVAFAAPEGTAYSVKAVAVDSVGTPSMYATYRIYAATDSVRPVTGAVTGDDGVIAATLPAAGDYRITITGMDSEQGESAFGVSDAAPVADLGTIALKPTSQALAEITVTAQRPLVIKEIDRIGYDVKNDQDSKTSPLIDVLRKVPMVTIDGDGNIQVNGSSDFKIYKNGRPNSAFTNNAKEIFKAIPASTIKRVEVITDPGAREDAEGVGAILNIVTDSSSELNGIVGSVSTYINDRNPVPGANLWLSSQLGKVVFSVNGGYFNNSTRETESTTTTDATYQTTGDRILSTNSSKSRANGGWGGLELSFEPDTLNLFTVEGNFFAYGVKPEGSATSKLFAPDGTLLQEYNTASRTLNSSYYNIDANVNYQRSTRRKGETITLSYRISASSNKGKSEDIYTPIYNFNVPYTGINSNTNQKFAEHTIQLDWSRPYGDKHKLDLGAKAIFRRNHSVSQMDYVGYNTVNEDFNHNTDIVAAYADYILKLGKWSMRAGMRYEYSHLAAKFNNGSAPDFGSPLHDYAPSASVSYTINDANTLKLSYNRRIQRPGIWALDPTINESPMTTSQGNPYLNSSNTDEVKLNYSLIRPKVNVDASLTYGHSGDGVRQTIRVEGDHTYYSYANAGLQHVVQLNAYARWSPTDKTSLMLNGTIVWGQCRNSLSGAEISRWLPFGYAQLQQKLPWKLRLTAWAHLWLSSLNSELQYTTNGGSGLWYGFRVQRSWLKNDALTVGVNITNPFGKYRHSSVAHYVNSDYLGTSCTQSARAAIAMLSVTYRFGSLNASVKKTAKSISNDDLSGAPSADGGNKAPQAN